MQGRSVPAIVYHAAVGLALAMAILLLVGLSPNRAFAGAGRPPAPPQTPAPPQSPPQDPVTAVGDVASAAASQAGRSRPAGALAGLLDRAQRSVGDLDALPPPPDPDELEGLVTNERQQEKARERKKAARQARKKAARQERKKAARQEQKKAARQEQKKKRHREERKRERLIERAEPGTALALLGSLEVRAWDRRSPYDRSLYGRPWADTEDNGCDTRSDVLRRDLVRKNLRNRCVVLAGLLAPDPYTEQRVHYSRRHDVDLDIDHVVAVYNSWRTGAQNWSAGKRRRFANDPIELLTVSTKANRDKGGSSASGWLPRNKQFRCNYVARQVRVKAKYGLWVTRGERATIADVLSTCRGQKVPKDPRFPSCKKALRHGFGPYRKTDPEYRWYGDRDDDGVACERG